MTEEEARRLKPGAKVLAYYSSLGWIPAIVQRVGVCCYHANVNFAVSVRRADLSGLPIVGIRHKVPEELRAVDFLDPFTANVYADFLEEHGESSAAELLRQHFPLEDGGGAEETHHTNGKAPQGAGRLPAE